MQQEKKFLELIGKHQNIVHKVCSMYRKEAADKEDLFQEIVLQAWKSFASFKAQSQFSTWLYRVALNTAISFYRKDQKKPVLVNGNVYTQKADESGFEEAQSAALFNAIYQLSHVDKALVLLFLDNYSYAEIASVLGITANNVAVKMNRIKIKLKTQTLKHFE
jgi:RNA polymerase sigma-70 factor, ECF subfamily